MQLVIRRCPGEPLGPWQFQAGLLLTTYCKIASSGSTGIPVPVSVAVLGAVVEVGTNVDVRVLVGVYVGVSELVGMDVDVPLGPGVPHGSLPL